MDQRLIPTVLATDLFERGDADLHFPSRVLNGHVVQLFNLFEINNNLAGHGEFLQFVKQK
jgi:hypothetical protein